MMPQSSPPAEESGKESAGPAKAPPVEYIKPVEDGLSLPKLLFMEKEWR